MSAQWTPPYTIGLPASIEIPVHIAAFRQAQNWCHEQIERELVDLFTAEKICIDRKGVRRVSRHTHRITKPFVEWIRSL